MNSELEKMETDNKNFHTTKSNKFDTYQIQNSEGHAFKDFPTLINEEEGPLRLIERKKKLEKNQKEAQEMEELNELNEIHESIDMKMSKFTIM